MGFINFNLVWRPEVISNINDLTDELKVVTDFLVSNGLDLNEGELDNIKKQIYKTIDIFEVVGSLDPDVDRNKRFATKRKLLDIVNLIDEIKKINVRRQEIKKAVSDSMKRLDNYDGTKTTLDTVKNLIIDSRDSLIEQYKKLGLKDRYVIELNGQYDKILNKINKLIKNNYSS